jgi:hypothetical protein
MRSEEFVGESAAGTPCKAWMHPDVLRSDKSSRIPHGSVFISFRTKISRVLRALAGTARYSGRAARTGAAFQSPNTSVMTKADAFERHT